MAEKHSGFENAQAPVSSNPMNTSTDLVIPETNHCQEFRASVCGDKSDLVYMAQGVRDICIDATTVRALRAWLNRAFPAETPAPQNYHCRLCGGDVTFPEGARPSASAGPGNKKDVIPGWCNDCMKPKHECECSRVKTRASTSQASNEEDMLDRAIDYYEKHTGHAGMTFINTPTLLDTLALLRELKERRVEVEKYKAWAASCNPSPPETPVARCRCGAYAWSTDTAKITDSRGRNHYPDQCEGFSPKTGPEAPACIFRAGCKNPVHCERHGHCAGNDCPVDDEIQAAQDNSDEELPF